MSGGALQGLPLPVPDADTKPFWDGTARDELLVQRCMSCSTWTWQPRPVCSVCGSLELAWTPVAGSGRVITWTVPRPPVLPALAELVPFVIAVVELDEGVRMIGMLVGDDGLPLRTEGTGIGLTYGRRVRVAFRDQDGFRQPGWALA
jgi:uncharacterized OB-fold protein